MKRFAILILCSALAAVQLGCLNLTQKDAFETGAPEQHSNVELATPESASKETDGSKSTSKPEAMENNATADKELIGTWVLYAIGADGNILTLKALGVTDEQWDLSFVLNNDGSCTVVESGEKKNIALWTKEDGGIKLHFSDHTLFLKYNGENLILEEDGVQYLFARQNTDSSEASDTSASSATGNPTPKRTGASYEVVYKKGTVYKTLLGSGIQVIVQIENTGSETLYIKSSSVDIEDANGHLVETKSYLSAYPEVLLPGETALIVESISLDNDPGVKEMTVIPHLNIEKAKIECTRYKITDQSFTNDRYTGLKMLGRVENTTSKTESMVYIVANLYDANHHGIGQLWTILTDDLKPGEKIGFTLSTHSASDSLTAESVASYEVFAFPYQFQF